MFRVVFLLLLFGFSPMVAQFQGTVTYRFFDDDDEDSDVVLAVGKNAILATFDELPGAESMSSMGLGKSSRLLIRFTEKDMVLFTDEKQAITMKFSEIANLANMAKQFGGESAKESTKAANMETRKTGATKDVLGYKGAEYQTKVYEKDNTEIHSAWVNDSDLSFPWKELGDLVTYSGLFEADDNFEWMDNNSFVLALSRVESGKDKVRIEAVKIDRTPPLPESFAIPTGYKQMSFSQYIQQLMMMQFNGGNR